MNVVSRIWNALLVVFKEYPALATGALSIGVLLGAKLGLNISANELLVIVAMVQAFLAAYVHSQVVPVRKLEKVGVLVDPIEVAAARVAATPSPTLVPAQAGTEVSATLDQTTAEDPTAVLGTPV